MAVWADFGEDDEQPDLVASQLTTHASGVNYGVHRRQPFSTVEKEEHHPIENPSAQSIAHALRCYPIAEKLAAYLDLTDLSSLSMTCRSIHGALNQFAHQLKQYSLRCTYDTDEKKHEEIQNEISDLREAFDSDFGITGQTNSTAAFPVSFYAPSPATGVFNSALGLSGKVSRCARDLVTGCRKCGIVVCRNCTEKPPSNRFLNNRLRRLCDACLEASLIDHLRMLNQPEDCNLPISSSSSTRSNRSESTSSEDSNPPSDARIHEEVEIPATFLRDPCTCASKGVYLCQQCGHNVRAADDIYRRVWSWRSRYSTHLGGGLGTGLGLGNQGQKCGRGKYCLSTRDAMALMETECHEDESLNLGSGEASRASTPLAHDSENGSSLRPKPGYFRQEIEGIGGVVKSKSKQLVKVGATVYEFRDERESGKYLEREAKGTLRSWCSWCSRVCAGEQDLLEVQKVLNLNQH